MTIVLYDEYDDVVAYILLGSGEWQEVGEQVQALEFNGANYQVYGWHLFSVDNLELIVL